MPSDCNCWFRIRRIDPICLTRMERLRPYLDHGILQLDTPPNAAWRAIALGQKNYLFVGSEPGGRAATIAYALVETATLNAVESPRLARRHLAHVSDYKIIKADELLPWKWRQ